MIAISYNIAHAPVAQLDRVLGYEPRGQEFESSRARQLHGFAPVAQLDRVLGFEPRGQEFESSRARQ